VSWYDNEGLSEPPYNFDTPVTGNITLYAKWKLSLEMVWINPGTFQMGSPENELFRDAIVFCNKLSRSEGLNPAYRINGSTDPAAWGSVPTNWDSPTKDAWDAVQMVAGSDGYRLPTEAQWEYACRAGTTTAYNTGDTISDDTGWYISNSDERTHEAGLKTPNAYGLYDMHGNVFEWCWDWYGPYTSGEQTDPTGPVSGSDRVIRGGSFEMPDSILRSAVRLFPFYSRDADMGFRLARILPPLTHTVTFDSGGGSPVTGQTVAEGKKVIRPPNPQKQGFDFDNWYSNPALTVLYNFDAPVSTGITLYAKWKLTIEMVWINPGTFTMGSPETEPERSAIADRETQHQVTLTKGFYMGKYPVTQRQYEAVMGTNPSGFTTPVSPETSTANRPVERVSWYDALVFCNKLSRSEGLNPAYRISGSTDPAVWGAVPSNKNATWDAVQIVEGSTGYRLPTEAQWEYVCRAGTTTPFNTGYNITTDQANYDGNTTPYNGNPSGIYRERTSEVGSFAPNAWDLYDMHGNVLEWCWDWYGIYTDKAQTDPTGADSGYYRVGRGGQWNLVGHSLRSAFRLDRNPIIRYDSIGFRLVRP
jgi:formylglycine-generating enzyme required for sulfatase activity